MLFVWFFLACSSEPTPLDFEQSFDGQATFNESGAINGSGKGILTVSVHGEKATASLLYQEGNLTESGEPVALGKVISFEGKAEERGDCFVCTMLETKNNLDTVVVGCRGNLIITLVVSGWGITGVATGIATEPVAAYFKGE